MNDLFESLSKNPMIIVVGILVLTCFFIIPCLFYSKYKKNKEKKFLELHEGQAF